jgi:hypothetical protein
MLLVVESNLKIFIHHCEDFDHVILLPRICVMEHIMVGQVEPLNVSLALFHHTVSCWLRFVELEEKTFRFYGFRTAAL